MTDTTRSPLGEDGPVRLEHSGTRATVTFHRPERRNSLDDATIAAVHSALDLLVSNSKHRLIVFRGSAQTFCTGMDLEAFGEGDLEGLSAQASAEQSPYMGLLKRLSSVDRVTVALVEGEVMAGGVGLVAACDLAVAGPAATFTLSETLWGLLPAMVMPFLVRRVGPQRAFRLTLSAETIDASEAHRIGMVDELAENPEVKLRALERRLSRLHPQTIADLKSYMRRMWILDRAMEDTAVQELSRLVQEPRVRSNIENYVSYGRLPWEAW